MMMMMMSKKTSTIIMFTVWSHPLRNIYLKAEVLVNFAIKVNIILMYVHREVTSKILVSFNNMQL